MFSTSTYFFRSILILRYCHQGHVFYSWKYKTCKSFSLFTFKLGNSCILYSLSFGPQFYKNPLSSLDNQIVSLPTQKMSSSLYLTYQMCIIYLFVFIFPLKLNSLRGCCGWWWLGNEKNDYKTAMYHLPW